MKTDSSQVIWVVTDPIQRELRLTDRGCAHIIRRHPEFEEVIDSLSMIAEEPKMILRDDDDRDTSIYCGLGSDIGFSSDLWVKMPARFDISDSGEVLTAYLTRQVPNGDIIWLPKNIID